MPKSYLRSVVILSVGFWGVFMAFNTAQALQTTISEKALADTCLAVLYACFTAMSIAAPKIVEMVGPKVSIIGGSAAYVFLVFSDMAPSYALSVPAFVLVGCSAAVLWTGEGVYLGRCAIRHARSMGEPEEEVTSRFNGIFFAAFQFCGFAGTLIASTIQNALGVERFAEANWYVFLAFGCVAGLAVLIFFALQCVNAPVPPPPSSLFLPPPSYFVGLLVSLALRRPAPPLGQDPDDRELPAGQSPPPERTDGASTTSSALDSETLPLASPDSEDEESARGAASSAAVVPVPAAESDVARITVWETLRLVVVSRPLQCLMPVMFYNGMSLAYFFSDYPGFYASRTNEDRKLLEPSMVGYVTATFYITNAVASYLFGKWVRGIGRRGVMTAASIAHAVFYTLVLLFLTSIHLHPKSGGAYSAAFLLAVIFAVGDAVWESQLPAVMQSSTFFPSERDRDAAMSNLKMWQSLGFAVQFALGFLVEDYWVKVVILVGLLIITVASLVILDRFVQPLDSSRSTERHTAASESLRDKETEFRSAPHAHSGGFEDRFTQPILRAGGRHAEN